MNHRVLLQQTIGLAGTLFLLIGCTLSSEANSRPAGESTSSLTPPLSPSSTLKPTVLPEPTLEPSPRYTGTPAPNDATLPAAVRTTATPTSCSGWTCRLRGAVYVNHASPGNELPGALVKLSHFSYCSPTEGEHETVTTLDGTFDFKVYLHDTDTFWFEVEEEGYPPVRLTIGGFDCLGCHCSPVEIVLRP